MEKKAAIDKSNSVKNLDSESIPCFASQRWILAYIGFLGVTLLSALTTNLSIAVVCMVKMEAMANGILPNGSFPNGIQCANDIENNTSGNNHPEFDWNKPLTSSMLASFCYGYILTQIPGGLMADRFGGRRVFGIAMLISSIAAIIFPVFTRLSYISVYVLRFITGLALDTVSLMLHGWGGASIGLLGAYFRGITPTKTELGVTLPAVSSVWGRWAPLLERSKLLSFTNLGISVGYIVTFPTAGFLCDFGFDNGWGSIFYVTGGVTLICVLPWFYLTADSPNAHSRITEAEKKYILSNIGYDLNNQTTTLPWKSILKSRAMWACLVAHVCHNWTIYTLTTSLPEFMKEALNFNIEQNGLLSSVPYIGQAIFGCMAGQAADLLRKKELVSTTGSRRLFQVSGFLGTGTFLVATTFTSCNQRYLTVVLLSLGVMFTGLSLAGVLCNHVDIAPNYAGVLFGITSTVATIPGIVTPITVGAMTPNQTYEEWRNVFYVCAGFALIGAIVFGFFSSGELQPWAKGPDEELLVSADYGSIKQSDNLVLK